MLYGCTAPLMRCTVRNYERSAAAEPLAPRTLGRRLRCRAARRIFRRAHRNVPDARSDAERARDDAAPSGARRPVQRLRQRVAAAAGDRASGARADAAARRMANRGAVRVGAPCAARAELRGCCRGHRRDHTRSRRRLMDAARAGPRRRSRSVARPLSHRRRHVGSAGRGARRAPARRNPFRGRHLHVPCDGVQQLGTSGGSRRGHQRHPASSRR